MTGPGLRRHQREALAALDRAWAAGAGGALLARLHAGGRALVEELAAARPTLLVLDECHTSTPRWAATRSP